MEKMLKLVKRKWNIKQSRSFKYQYHLVGLVTRVQKSCLQMVPLQYWCQHVAVIIIAFLAGWQQQTWAERMQKATEVAPLQPLQPISLRLGLSKYQRRCTPAAWNSRTVLCHVDPNHTICEDLRSCSIISISLLNQPKKNTPSKKNGYHLSTLHTYINIILISNYTIPGIIHPQSTAPHQTFQNH